MTPKLLFITSHYFLQPTRDALERLDLPCHTLVVPYDDFDHIAQVFGQYADQYDACLISGVIAKLAIEMVYPNPGIPLIAFQTSPNALHRDILQTMLAHQNMELDRIAMDFLVATGEGYSVADFLKTTEVKAVYANNARKMELTGIRKGHTLEDVLVERIAALWDQGAIDFVICQYSSIIPRLQELGIPFRCSFVSDDHLNSLIQEVLAKLELQALYDNHPVIIQIFPRQTGGFSQERFQMLHYHVQQFIRANLMECIIQSADSCCVVITSVKILRFLTDEFRSCMLSGYLTEHLGFPVLVAYGIGTTVPHAMNNVQTASREAKISGMPYIVDSKGCLIGPLNSERHMVLSADTKPDLSELARRCGLSSMTIQKLVTVLQNIASDKITTQELAVRMHTTVRNANRIMLNLCKGGVASPVYTQATHSRGRPIQVYSINLGIPTENLE